MIAATPTLTPEFILEPIRIADLRLDARYQRELNEPRVRKMVEGYRPELLQPLLVGMRKEGTLHVVDGQHRLVMLRRLGWVDAPCQIFESHGFEHEAEVFQMLQEQRRPLTVAERWKARLARKESQATIINELVEGLGLKLSGKSGPMQIQCFTAIEKAYERGVLREVLLVIIGAWSYDITGFRDSFIDGVSLLIAAIRYEDIEMDFTRLTKALAKISPSTFLREVALGKNPNAVFMRMVLDKYNIGARNAHRIIVDDPAGFIDRYRRDKGTESLMVDPEAVRARNTELSKRAAIARIAKAEARKRPFLSAVKDPIR